MADSRTGRAAEVGSEVATGTEADSEVVIEVIETVDLATGVGGKTKETMMMTMISKEAT